MTTVPDERGRFGQYGGQYVPETVMGALAELEAAYLEAKVDPAFQAELASLLHEFVGRPTALYHAKGLTAHAGGAHLEEIFLKVTGGDAMIDVIESLRAAISE